MDHKKLLDSLGQLNHLFSEALTVEVLLDKTVDMLAELTNSDVCSIYLYNGHDQSLVLRATQGLKDEAVGNIRLGLGQGLTGLCIESLKPVCEEEAFRNPHFKFFPGIYEELYECFLAVPIKRGQSRIGVLVLQRQKGNCYDEYDVAALESVASTLANIIDNARFVMDIHEQPKEDQPRQADYKNHEELAFVKGKVASEGFAYGPAFMLDKARSMSLLMSRDFEKQYGPEDLRRALRSTASQLEQLQQQVEMKLSDAAAMIFASHLMILKDNYFVGEMEKKTEQGLNAPQAVLQVSRQYMQSFATSDSPYMQEKIHDVQDLTIRIISNLVEDAQDMAKATDRIVIARQLFPSDLLKLSSERAKGIILVSGGVTSHLAILARSLQMPMIIANEYKLLEVPANVLVMLDAHVGMVYIKPDQQILEKFENQLTSHVSLQDQADLIKPQTFTADGTRVHLYANINLLSDLHFAKMLQVEGVGLYRTEFPFMIRSDFPTETEQYSIYSKLVAAMANKPITFRTLDIGGDKVLSYYHDTKEQNPALGMRSIRFSLAHEEIFDVQLRAILRAGIKANVRIMFPMISSLDDFLEAKEAVHRCSRQLRERGIEHNASPAIGMMIELPAVVNMIEDFAQEADFFSIGTNDFVQFMLGVDRTNETVADLYLPHHPAVLRALNRITAAANHFGREVSICGDMASNPRYVQFLLGIGIRHLSLEAGYMLRIQQAISGINMENATQMARELLQAKTINDTSRILKSARKQSANSQKT